MVSDHNLGLLLGASRSKTTVGNWLLYLKVVCQVVLASNFSPLLWAFYGLKRLDL